MLSSNRDTVEFEANMIFLVRCPTAKRFMELEANFVLMDKVHMTLIPVALFSVLLANKDTITW